MATDLFPNKTNVSNPSLVVESTKDLKGRATAGTKFGINTTTGRMFYVNSAGNWKPIDNVQEFKTVAGATGANTFNYSTYKGDVWYVTIPTGTNGSITDITNELGDGQRLTIMVGTAGGGTLTLTHNTAKIYLSGAANAVLTADKTITLLSRGGVWYEESRA
jgi:hypothetical protein